MAKFFIGIFLFCMACFAGAPPKDGTVLAWIEPYTKCTTILTTTGIWSATAFHVFELRTKDAGMIRVKLVDDAAYTNLYATTYDVLRLKISSIDLDSCTADTIMVFGYPK